MRKYPKYKSSEIEYISEIPQHWEVWKLKFLVKEKLKYGANEAAELDDRSLPRYIRITDFNNDGKLKNETFKSLQFEIAKEYLLENGDILFARSGATVGKTLLFENYDGLACFAGYLIKASCHNHKMAYKFLDYYTSSSSYENWKNMVFIQSTIQNIGADKYNLLVIPKPPLPEQYSIVRFLDHKTDQIDRFITNRQKQIELLKEQKAAIINKAVTKGIDPDAKMKPSGIEWIGDIPAHWSVTKVKFVAKVKGRIGFRGYTISDLVEEGQGALTLGATHINKEGTISLSKPVFINWEKYYESPEIMVENGDILVVQRGSIGLVGIVNSEIGCATINPSLTILKRVKMNKQLLFLQLRSKTVREAIKTIFNETAVPMLSQNQISNFNILLPPSIEEQVSIIEFITSETSTIDTLISKYQKQIDLMQEYRTSLISQAVTGKIDVRDWRPKTGKLVKEQWTMVVTSTN